MKPYTSRGPRPLSLLLVAATLLGAGFSPAARADAPATNAAPSAAPAPAQEPVDPITVKLRDAYQHLRKGELDAAVAEASDVIKADPKNEPALLLRGSLYANQKQWAQAQADYDAALAANPANSIVKFDESELKFLQKDYNGARPGFLALTKDKDEDLADLANFKVFLCDLFGGNDAQAQKELDAFNEVGGNPSYYFANASWDLVHHNTDDAVSWLGSAARIYSDAPQKLANYSSSLRSLGYLPLKPAAAAQAPAASTSAAPTPATPAQ